MQQAGVAGCTLEYLGSSFAAALRPARNLAAEPLYIASISFRQDGDLEDSNFRIIALHPRRGTAQICLVSDTDSILGAAARIDGRWTSLPANSARAVGVYYALKEKLFDTAWQAEPYSSNSTLGRGMMISVALGIGLRGVPISAIEESVPAVVAEFLGTDEFALKSRAARKHEICYTHLGMAGLKLLEARQSAMVHAYSVGVALSLTALRDPSPIGQLHRWFASTLVTFQEDGLSSRQPVQLTRWPASTDRDAIMVLRGLADQFSADAKFWPFLMRQLAVDKPGSVEVNLEFFNAAFKGLSAQECGIALFALLYTDNSTTPLWCTDSEGQANFVWGQIVNTFEECVATFNSSDAYPTVGHFIRDVFSWVHVFSGNRAVSRIRTSLMRLAIDVAEAAVDDAFPLEVILPRDREGNVRDLPEIGITDHVRRICIVAESHIVTDSALVAALIQDCFERFKDDMSMEQKHLLMAYWGMSTGSMNTPFFIGDFFQTEMSAAEYLYLAEEQRLGGSGGDHGEFGPPSEFDQDSTVPDTGGDVAVMTPEAHRDAKENNAEAVRILEAGIERFPGSSVLIARLQALHMELLRYEKVRKVPLIAIDSALSDTSEPSAFESLVTAAKFLPLPDDKDFELNMRLGY